MAAALHWLFKLVTTRGYVAKSDTFIGAWILGKAQNTFSDNIGHLSHRYHQLCEAPEHPCKNAVLIRQIRAATRPHSTPCSSSKSMQNEAID